MAQVKHKDFESEPKCGGCNWNATRFYSIAGMPKQGTGMERAYIDNGLCAHCFLDMVIENKLDVG